ncbi:cobalamin B12-binding domain-containing protein [Opitutus terrae]|uniref:Cobalamin B12-binding domain protein n=1 Tax=Opitutus terrae (strain DSM 11246 / JCM 15787 / PB90-1) TaxID=452637 RepID=B1ZXE0_OPITP|nr:corrinoid protein [Opitutus terrae]ACB76935.1 cobalamin B12-binding domain protein [Opitutus terrae PB90-1]
MTTFEQLSQAVVAGKSKDAKALTQQALTEGAQPGAVVDQALVPAMAIVGDRFRDNQIFVPEMLMSARAMKESLAILEPKLLAAGVQPKYTAVIGSVHGDLHDIGKNLVAIMWKGANFRVVDLGVNVSPAKFVAAIQQHQPQVVGLSTLLTTTMPAMVETVRVIRASGCPPVKIMVGGAPVTQQFANEIGADGYSADASAAVEVALKLIGA